MKKLINGSILVIALLIPIGMQMGCATSSSTPTTVSAANYRTIGTVKIAVDTGMKIWADRVIDGKTTPAQEAKVRAAFDTYRATTITYIDANLSDSTAAPADITNAAIALINLLNSFGAKVTPLTGAK
jgi:hypothetical protein